MIEDDRSRIGPREQFDRFRANRRADVVVLLNSFSPEDRLDIFSNYCRGCGTELRSSLAFDPMGASQICHCENDE